MKYAVGIRTSVESVKASGQILPKNYEQNRSDLEMAHDPEPRGRKQLNIFYSFVSQKL